MLALNLPAKWRVLFAPRMRMLPAGLRTFQGPKAKRVCTLSLWTYFCWRWECQEDTTGDGTFTHKTRGGIQVSSIRLEVVFPFQTHETLVSSSRTGLVYDVAMTRHQNEVNPYHPETPERISETWHALEVKGYLERCTLLEVCCSCGYNSSLMSHTLFGGRSHNVQYNGQSRTFVVW